MASVACEQRTLRPPAPYHRDRRVRDRHADEERSRGRRGYGAVGPDRRRGEDCERGTDQVAAGVAEVDATPAAGSRAGSRRATPPTPRPRRDSRRSATNAKPADEATAVPDASPSRPSRRLTALINSTVASAATTISGRGDPGDDCDDDADRRFAREPKAAVEVAHIVRQTQRQCQADRHQRRGPCPEHRHGETGEHCDSAEIGHRARLHLERSGTIHDVQIAMPLVPTSGVINAVTTNATDEPQGSRPHEHLLGDAAVHLDGRVTLEPAGEVGPLCGLVARGRDDVCVLDASPSQFVHRSGNQRSSDSSP